MKNTSFVLLITGLLLVVANLDATAQKRNSKTASARAAYGYPAEKKKSKPKTKKKFNRNGEVVSPKSKEVKRRRKDGWAG